MNKFFLISGITLVILATLVGLIIGNSSYASSPLADVPSYPAIPSPIPSALPITSPPPGITDAGVSSSAITGVPAIKGPITEASIRSYLSDPINGMVITHGHISKILNIQFLYNSQLQEVLQDKYLNNLPENTPLIYVTTTGDFEDDTPILHNGYIVFDARTGNLIMSGAK